MNDERLPKLVPSLSLSLSLNRSPRNAQLAHQHSPMIYAINQKIEAPAVSIDAAAASADHTALLLNGDLMLLPEADASPVAAVSLVRPASEHPL